MSIAPAWLVLESRYSLVLHTQGTSLQLFSDDLQGWFPWRSCMSPNGAKESWGEAWHREEDSNSPESCISPSYKILSLCLFPTWTTGSLKASSKNHKKLSDARMYPPTLTRRYQSDNPRTGGREHNQEETRRGKLFIKKLYLNLI